MGVDGVGREVGGTGTVEIIERRLLCGRQQFVGGAVINIRVPDVGIDLLHPAGLLRAGINGIPCNTAAGLGEIFRVVVRIHPHAQSDLFEVGSAGNRPRLLLGRRQRRQQHRRQNRDDGDDDKQFNQGECPPGSCVWE